MGFIEPTTCPKTLINFNKYRYPVFIGTLIVNYFLIRYLSQKFQWEYRKKTSLENYQDITFLVILGTVVFVFGNYAQTFDHWTVSSILITTFVYGWITNLPTFKVSLVGWRNWTGQVWSAVIISLSVLALVFGYMIKQSYNCNTLLEISIYAIIAVLWFVGLSISNHRNNLELERIGGDKKPLHIHHYQWSYALAFFFSFDSIISKIGSGIILGIFVNGLAVYGPDKS